jgi:anthranilate/para-aminobenzoate synthase component II
VRRIGHVGCLDSGFGADLLGDGIHCTVLDHHDVKDKDIILLYGGEDISPSLYGQKLGRSHATEKPSYRDKMEFEVVKEAVRLGKPIFGICRGAQLLCIYAGGTLFQHVDGHNDQKGHSLKTITGHTIYSNSCHHQAMRLDPDAMLIAEPVQKVAKWRFAEGDKPVESDEPEVEMAWWPQLNAVGVQGHPEWLGHSTPMVKYCSFLVKEYLNV